MIWCVEDDGSIRDIEVYALQSAGLAARGFGDGSSFWEAVQKERPDLVVLDIMLPGVDGVELLRRIRERPELSAIPVVMATATIQMVTESIEAYVKSDIMLAKKVVSDDDTVDACFDQVKSALIARVAADPADGEYAVDLLMIAKYFERIGDHATNIAEWVIFSVTGAHGEVYL